MAEENKDLNTNQSVTGSDLNNAQVVAEPDLNASGQGEGELLADGSDENKKVPYTELKKAIDEKNAAEEQAKLLQSQMALINANQQQQVVQSQPQQPLSVYEQAKADLGLTGEEFIDESQRGKIYARINEITQLQNQQTAAAIANQQFEASHPDFGNVVGLRNPLNGQIQPTAEISKILTEKPHLIPAAYASSQGAYEIVMQQRKLDELQKQNTAQEEHLKQQGIDTKLAPVSGAAATGGALSAKTAGAISAEQQAENERKVAAGEFK